MTTTILIIILSVFAIFLLGFIITLFFVSKRGSRDEKVIFLGLRKNDGTRILDAYATLDNNEEKVNYLNFGEDPKFEKYKKYLKSGTKNERRF